VVSVGTGDHNFPEVVTLAGRRPAVSDDWKRFFEGCFSTASNAKAIAQDMLMPGDYVISKAAGCYAESVHRLLHEAEQYAATTKPHAVPPYGRRPGSI